MKSVLKVATMKKIDSDVKLSIKEKRQIAILLGLVEHYIKTGKAVGSNTLKESGFKSLSSATIRNYFSDLEKDGYLHQQHVSGGRIPTEKAFRTYIQHVAASRDVPKNFDEIAASLASFDSKEIGRYLPKVMDLISEITGLPVFMSTPRYDQDFLTEIKLIPIGNDRIAALLITDFGIVKMELVPIDIRLNIFSIKRIEDYFHYRLHGLEPKPENLGEEEDIAETLYNELMVRFVIGHSSFQTEDILRTGFAKLLANQDFQDTHQVAACLALFENAHAMRLVLRDCYKRDTVRFWIGEDLLPFSPLNPGCAMIVAPYHINNQPVGALGVMGPARIPYKTVIGILRNASSLISNAITSAIYKFKITYRQPDAGLPLVVTDTRALTTIGMPILLEDGTKQ